MTHKELQLLNGLGLFRFYMYKFLRLVIRVFFPEDKISDITEIMFKDRRLVEIVIDPKEIYLYPAGTHDNSYYCKWRNYKVWIANEDYGLHMDDEDTKKCYRKEDLPASFRKALYATYVDVKRNSVGRGPEPERFLVPADTLRAVGPLSHLCEVP